MAAKIAAKGTPHVSPIKLDFLLFWNPYRGIGPRGPRLGLKVQKGPALLGPLGTG